ncbi:hypothetical protein OG864_29885 [Streptomyces sp. NBC_00124]|uniref:hypothetical protein n=1 Tax=Streptomyces sp. NBC_00124 TaxID=2975662 RepID=UPI002254500C|nr:hypothetical protein [Streptomyces sp. NBC_00124]MCX5362913.1 hypothetical protein [Streptomyces sp. NBC_00124]
MNNAEPTQAPRAAQAVKGAEAARRHVARTGVIARQLEQIAPGTVRVRIVPVWKKTTGEGRTRTWVVLDSATGPVDADREQHRAAYNLLRHMFPGADWTQALAYDARTGELIVDAPCAPAELGLAEGAER